MLPNWIYFHTLTDKVIAKEYICIFEDLQCPSSTMVHDINNLEETK